MAFKRWVSSPPDKDGAAVLAEACGLHPFLALMLSLRGVTDAEEAEAFLLDLQIIRIEKKEILCCQRK